MGLAFHRESGKERLRDEGNWCNCHVKERKQGGRQNGELAFHKQRSLLSVNVTYRGTSTIVDPISWVYNPITNSQPLKSCGE